jgi:hypothetical protein
MTEDELNEALTTLLDLGLISVEYDENLEAHFSLTEEGIQEAKRRGM